MKKTNIIFGIIILALVSAVLWQWISSSGMKKENWELGAYNDQLRFLLGIGELGSAHQHADVKVYTNLNPIDFSQSKYQLTSNYIHFEEGIGDVIHTHAAGMTVGHMFRGVGMTFTNECLIIDEEKYCNDTQNSLKFYVNGKPNILFDNYVINDMDKILVSYGPRGQNVNDQLAAITDLAIGYSSK